MSEVLKGMVTEAELLQIMGLKKSELSGLRNNKGMPYVKLTVFKRVYLEDDLMEWFRSKRVVSDPVSHEPVGTILKASQPVVRPSETLPKGGEE